jgi:hypothetical protein
MVAYAVLDEFPYHRIGDDGSVWSRQRKYRRAGDPPWRRLNGSCGKSTSGYVAYCILDLNNKPRKILGHTLVLRAFRGPAPEGHESCHGNGVRNDNRLENLRWGTYRENHHDSIRHGTKPHGSRHYNAKLTEEQVVDIRRLRSTKRVPVKQLATHYGVTEACIKTIIYGRSWARVGSAT